VLNGDILQAANEFHKTNGWPKGCNTLFIALIPNVIVCKS